MEEFGGLRDPSALHLEGLPPTLSLLTLPPRSLSPPLSLQLRPPLYRPPQTAPPAMGCGLAWEPGVVSRGPSGTQPVDVGAAQDLCLVGSFGTFPCNTDKPNS